MKDLLFLLDGSEKLARKLCRTLSLEKGRVQIHSFPDGESHLRVLTPCVGRRIVLLVDLSYPNPKIPNLLFLADTLRKQGAIEVGLVIPYLPYMRQDRSFNPGEAITSRTFAKIISSYFDWLITVDPHLHRYHFLSEIYSVPTKVVPAAPSMAQWIKRHVNKPVLIGPDEESVQWVSRVADEAKVPFIVLQKKRKGDRRVVISTEGLETWKTHTPVLVDDIISTGHTLMETMTHLRKLGFKRPVCVGVHGLFVENAYGELKAKRPLKIVTCNTLAHSTNKIDLSLSLSQAIKIFLEREK